MKVSDDVRRCAPRGLWRGEGAPGGAAGGLADDAGGDQVLEQAQGRLQCDHHIPHRALQPIAERCL